MVEVVDRKKVIFQQYIYIIWRFKKGDVRG